MELTYDPVTDAVDSGLLMDWRHYVLPDGEFVRWIRKVSGHDDLFIYWHRVTGRFVLAQWLTRAPRSCTEIDTWDQHPDRIPREIEDIHYWHLRLKTDRQVKRAMATKLAEARYEEKAARRESAESRAIVAKRLKSRGFDAAGELMAIGATPHIGEREAKNLGVHGAFDFLKPKGRRGGKR